MDFRRREVRKSKKEKIKNPKIREIMNFQYNIINVIGERKRFLKFEEGGK